MPAKKRRTNIFLKYFLLFSAIFLLSFTILGSSLLLFVNNYWQREKTDLLKDNAGSLARTVQTVLKAEDLNSEYSYSKMLVANSLSLISSSIDADVFITDAQGRVILCKERASASTSFQFIHCLVHDQHIISEKYMKAAFSNGLIARGRIYENDATKYFLVGQAIVMDGQNVGAVFATMPMKGIQMYTTDLLRMFLLSGIFSLLLSFIGVYFLTYKMLTPLQQMAKATKQFAKGNFSYRVSVHGNDEFSDLAEGFNDMAQSLATLESSRRSFVANVSHELKTPMTTIGGFIDGVLDGTIPPEKQHYYLKIVSDEVKRLSRLVVAMLNMSKIEAGEFKIKPVDYDISDQIFHVFLSFEQNIEKKQIQIVGLDQMAPLHVQADSDMIYQVIYNLVDNAVKFTNPGGCIAVSATEESTRIFVRVRNSGNGVAPEELSRIFERFYKVDRSRSLDVKGAGLGLYIVKSMIELHGGQITVLSEEGQYTEFIFWLPKRQTPGDTV